MQSKTTHTTKISSIVDVKTSKKMQLKTTHSTKVSPIVGVRRMEPKDSTAIKHLISRTTRDYFGDFNLEYIIEHSFLSLCVYNDIGNIVAAICLQNYPNVPAIPGWEWLPWIQGLYNFENLTHRNTLFIGLMVWDGQYKSKFIPHLLTNVFKSFIYLHQLILVAPPGVPTLFFIEEHFTRVLPQSYSDLKKVQTIYISLRQHYVQCYKIRRAVEEDNDDIIPLVNRHAPYVKELYGEYYISEIIRCKEDPNITCCDQREIIVAERDEVAGGVLVLSSNVTFDVINDCFEVTHYNGFKKPCPDDAIPKRTHLNLLLPDNLSIQYEGTFEQEEGGTLEEDDMSTSVPVQLSSSSSQSSISGISSISNLIETIIDDDLERISSTKESPPMSTTIVEKSTISCEMHNFLHDRDNKYDNQNYSLSLQHRNSTTVQLPKFRGDPNAFVIELFAVDEDIESDVTTDLIVAAFECFPDREYCLLTFPSTYPPWPLMQIFVRVSPRPFSVYPHELYCLHRNALLSDLEVREGSEDDLLAVKNLLNGMMKENEIFNDFMASIFDHHSLYRSYVLTSESCIVGFIILCEDDNTDYLSAHYTLNSYFGLEHYSIGSIGRLVHAAISPIFQTQKRFFFREVHRLSDLPALYYRLYKPDETHADQILANMVAEMIPVEPRVRPEYHPNKEVDGDVPREFVTRIEDPFTLFIINMRYCSIPKFDVCRKIVVVGASSTGLAFIENMIFGRTASYISFTNITVVTSHGFPCTKPPHKVRDLLFPFEGRLDYRHARKISFNSYVNLVVGYMTAINRKDKTITVNKEFVVPYDSLFLTCGEQFHLPEKYSKDKCPKNIFIINAEEDGEIALEYIDKIKKSQIKCNIIVYGSSLEAYCCLTAVLESGIPGSCISFVEPFPPLDDSDCVSVFNDGEVDTAITASIEQAGIEIYRSHYFHSWKCNKVYNNIVETVVFESKSEMVHLACSAMFFYQQKTINPATIASIIRAGGLVYDGRLVIDNLFQTKDPNIYAAGSLTKYSRRYYADDLSQKYFNHFEVGARLALYTKRNFDPTYEKKEDAADNYVKKVLTPLFSQPIIRYCTLPGNYHYLYVTKPGRAISIEAQINQEDYGRVLVTGDLNTGKQGYFRLHLNQNNIVETITCLTKGEIDVQNMIKLWGKHEQLLNNLVRRFEMVLITDLFDYFRQPWVYAIFHESFTDQVEEFNSLVLNGNFLPDCNDSILKEIIRTYRKEYWHKLSNKQLVHIKHLYEKSPHKEKIEENLLHFLLTYDMHLPVYAHPLKVKLILSGHDNSPLHLPQ